MPRRKRQVFTIPAAQLEKLGQRALLDMLRYDAAVVLGEYHGEYLLTNAHGPTTGRWASFGITVTSTREEYT